MFSFDILYDKSPTYFDTMQFISSNVFIFYETSLPCPNAWLVLLQPMDTRCAAF